MIYFQCSFHTTLKILVKTKNYTLFFSLIQFLPSIHSHMVLKGFETSEGFPILFTFRTFSTVRFLSVCFLCVASQGNETAKSFPHRVFLQCAFLHVHKRFSHIPYIHTLFLSYELFHDFVKNWDN